MATRTITALFDSLAGAQRAADQLVGARTDRNAISIISQVHKATAAAATERRDEGGFWSSLASLPLPDEDRHTYIEGIRRGSVLLTAAIDEARADSVMRILEDDGGAVDLDERECEWWASGWRGYRPTTGQQDATRGRAARTRSDRRGADMVDAEEAILVDAEEPRAGKRELGRGSVRVRSYVAECSAKELPVPCRE